MLNDIQKAYADAFNNRRTGTDVPWVHSITVSHQACFLLPAEFYVKDNMGRLKLIVISRLVIRWFEIEAAESYKGTDFFLDGVSPCCCPLCALILIVREMGMGDASGYFHSILQAPGLKFIPSVDTGLLPFCRSTMDFLQGPIQGKRNGFLKRCLGDTNFDSYQMPDRATHHAIAMA